MTTETNEPFVFVIHGGAGVISKSIVAEPYLEALTRVVRQIYKFAFSQSCKSAIDIVEYGISLLEDEVLFNAGKGAVYTCAGTHELDAAVMDGSNLQCGAVSLVKMIKNPISAARNVMEKTEHCYIIGESAETLALANGGISVANNYFDSERRWIQLQEAQRVGEVTGSEDTKQDEAAKGTVGCVCLFKGHLAAGTSTGGTTNKICGRIGDSPIIGAGTYANDNTCAVSSTGHGEEFIRQVAAYNVSACMEYGRMSLEEAGNVTVHGKLPKNSGGLIAVDRSGVAVMPFNTSGMFRGVCDDQGSARIGIWEELIEINVRI